MRSAFWCWKVRVWNLPVTELFKCHLLRMGEEKEIILVMRKRQTVIQWSSEASCSKRKSWNKKWINHWWWIGGKGQCNEWKQVEMLVQRVKSNLVTTNTLFSHQHSICLISYLSLFFLSWSSPLDFCRLWCDSLICEYSWLVQGFFFFSHCWCIVGRDLSWTDFIMLAQDSSVFCPVHFSLEDFCLQFRQKFVWDDLGKDDLAWGRDWTSSSL